jgi:hypothetical protein
MRSRKLVFLLAFAATLMPIAYLGWVYYSTYTKLDPKGQKPPSTPPLPPGDQWFTMDPVDPTNLHGVWSSSVEAKGEAGGQESVLDIRPDGTLLWIRRTFFKDGPETEIVEWYDYAFQFGRFLMLTLKWRSCDGEELKFRDTDGDQKMWKLDWKAEDKSSFQIRTDMWDHGRQHLLFRRTPAKEK